ncbi:hypothetical protein SO802_031608 [Lithocarpus litseifolius]|uniref:Uncharacterized protein n=1 Tax=Lithocarpus litseifolius TaxID=425828 RepID=A0AAW2BND1_9ROSI
MYSLCGNIKFDNYLNVGDVRVWLISCFLDFNRNSTGENVRVRDNWLAGDLTRDVGRQLWASHLILGCNLIYSTWHSNFLPPSLTVGEAQDFGPWIVRAESLVLMRDDSRITDQPPRGSGDTLSNTPPPWVTGGIVIQEPAGNAQPTTQVGSNVAFSSQLELAYVIDDRLKEAAEDADWEKALSSMEA